MGIDLKLVMKMEKNKYQSMEKKEKKVEGQITEWMIKCVVKEAELKQYKNLLRVSVLS